MRLIPYKERYINKHLKLPQSCDSDVILEEELENYWVFQMALDVAMYTTELTPIYQLPTNCNRSLGS